MSDLEAEGAEALDRDAPALPTSDPGDPPNEPETDEDEGAEADAEDGDGEGDLTAEELEEIEYEGKRHKVAKELKDAFLRQQDYTRKTQEVADQRKAFEAQQAEFERSQQTSREFIREVAQVQSIDEQLAQAQNIDWDTWDRQDPIAAQSAWRKVQMLKEQRQSLVSSVTQKEQERISREQHTVAKRLEEVRTFAKTHLPGYDADMDQQAAKLLTEELGWDQPTIVRNLTPAFLKVIHAELTQRRAKARATAAVKSKPPEQVQPVKPVARGRGSVKPGLDDTLSADEWVKRRNEQLRGR